MIEELYKYLNRNQEQGFINIRLKDRGNWDYRDYYIIGDRLETDSEYYERIEQEKIRLEKKIQAKEQAEQKRREKALKEIEKEKKLFEQLKKKYEK